METFLNINLSKMALEFKYSTVQAVKITEPDYIGQSIIFPIPKKLMPKVKRELNKIINQDDLIVYKSLSLEDSKDYEDLIDKRTKEFNKIKEKYHLLLIEALHEFRSNNAELFI